MGFYEQIGRYYDYIFPTGQAQIKFITDSAGMPPREILDVACGSGGYSIELSKKGYRVAATDLDAEMVRLAKEKAAMEGLQIEVFQADMLEIGAAVSSNYGVARTFDCVFCIGNSLVHLGSLKDIEKAVLQMNMLLKPGGSLILQIINFDRVLKYRVSELPTLRNEMPGLEFVRRYEHRKDKNTISFNTVLSVNGKDGREVYENSVELFPALSKDVIHILELAGFKDIVPFGGFEGSKFDEKAYLLVVRAVK